MKYKRSTRESMQEEKKEMVNDTWIGVEGEENGNEI